jgi:hypothetical protein
MDCDSKSLRLGVCGASRKADICTCKYAGLRSCLIIVVSFRTRLGKILAKAHEGGLGHISHFRDGEFDG